MTGKPASFCLPTSAPRIGVALTTYDRVDDARCCLEVLRSRWQPGPFPDLVIVHAYNGRERWYTAKLEDRLLTLAPSKSHYRGAAALLDAALQELANHGVHYAVAMTGDTWAYRPEWVAQVIAEMASNGFRLAAARWLISPTAHGLARTSDPQLLPNDGLSTDFFVVDLPWAVSHGLLPLRYDSFLEQHADLLNYLQEMPFLERFLAGKYLGAVRDELALGSGKDPWGSAGPRHARRLLRLLHERPIDPAGQTAPAHQGHWPDIGLLTSHDVEAKRDVARAHSRLVGPTLDRLRASHDLSWYNSPIAERIHRDHG